MRGCYGPRTNAELFSHGGRASVSKRAVGGGIIHFVEDDERIREEVACSLREAGFVVWESGSLAQAGARGSSGVDLLLLDLELPDGDGLELARELRGQDPQLPILVLTARDAVEERVRGLDCGADDYLVKPFALTELHARTRSLLRRSHRQEGGRILRAGELWLDPEERRAGRGASPLRLARREFDLLAFFLRRPNRPLRRERLLEGVWGRDFEGGPRTVDVHVRRLRMLVERDPAVPELLLTEYGVGYVLRVPAP